MIHWNIFAMFLAPMFYFRCYIFATLQQIKITKYLITIRSYGRALWHHLTLQLNRRMKWLSCLIIPSRACKFLPLTQRPSLQPHSSSSSLFSSSELLTYYDFTCTHPSGEVLSSICHVVIIKRLHPFFSRVYLLFYSSANTFLCLLWGSQPTQSYRDGASECKFYSNFLFCPVVIIKGLHPFFYSILQLSDHVSLSALRQSTNTIIQGW